MKYSGVKLNDKLNVNTKRKQTKKEFKQNVRMIKERWMDAKETLSYKNH